MSPLKAFIFDWAGTMIDFGCLAPVVALQQAFLEIGLELSEQEARADMGMAKRAHIEAILSRDPMREAFVQKFARLPDEAAIDDIFKRVEPAMITQAALRTELIDGAADLAALLRAKNIRIGSGTGYSRSMMGPILAAARAQDYEPEVVVCAGETPFGRPSPLMSWKALVELGVWPAHACVKVDDAEVGIVEGREAGLWTIGVAASGNGIGLSLDQYEALDQDEKSVRLDKVSQKLADSGADYVVRSVRDIIGLVDEIGARSANGDRPGAQECRIFI